MNSSKLISSIKNQEKTQENQSPSLTNDKESKYNADSRKKFQNWLNTIYNSNFQQPIVIKGNIIKMFLIQPNEHIPYEYHQMMFNLFNTFLMNEINLRKSLIEKWNESKASETENYEEKANEILAEIQKVKTLSHIIDLIDENKNKEKSKRIRPFAPPRRIKF